MHIREETGRLLKGPIQRITRVMDKSYITRISRERKAKFCTILYLSSQLRPQTMKSKCLHLVEALTKLRHETYCLIDRHCQSFSKSEPLRLRCHGEQWPSLCDPLEDARKTVYRS